MFFRTFAGLLSILVALAELTNGAVITERAETHKVTLINRCGSGHPRFRHSTGGPFGSTTINGPLHGGVAWLGSYKDCGDNGVNCGTVEFALINPDTDPYNTQNSVNYSLLDGPGLGNHKFEYPMHVAYNGGGDQCAAAIIGACNGGTPASCPRAFFGSATEGGAPLNCVGANAGVTITFC